MDSKDKDVVPCPRDNRTVNFFHMMCSIVVVIVLYATEVRDCISLHSLLQAAAQLPPDTLNLKVLLHDNTPEPTPNQLLPPNVSYHHDPRNSGLANAYNGALRLALAQGFDWLLTLDQDTSLPVDSLGTLLRVVTSLRNRPDVAAILPQICAGGRIVSPNWFVAGGWPRWFPSGYTGIPSQTTFAFNSGSLLRVAALRQAGGYSPWFWLDNSDASIYRQLAKLGKRVYVCGEVQIAHDFSMQNMAEKVSPQRYRTLLLSESAFWDLEMNAFAGLERTLRLAGRFVKHLLRRDNVQLRQLTVEALWLRLFRTRRFRLARWRKLIAPVIARFAEPALPALPGTRPRVSVCMAVYNGARFLREQLDSILPQLNASDEMVLIDDRSTDGTSALLEQFRQECAADPLSPTLILLTHEENQGVIRTFEETLRAATGDILFLADDDDRWAPNKVNRVLAAFAEDDLLQIVSTGVEMMDEAGRPIASSNFLRHRLFSDAIFANLLHNQFQGSTLALRSAALQEVLPFPNGKLFLHDAWIGLRLLLHGGKVRHLAEPLLFYRRHGANVSQRLSRWKQVKLRLQLISALFRAAGHRL